MSRSPAFLTATLIAVLGFGHAHCQNSAVFTIENVTVIPMDKEGMLTNQTVVIENGIIKKISANANASIPRGATRVDGKGKFLIPGLMDMHAHFFQEQYPDHKSTTELELKMMLANGVTTARILAGHPDYLQAKANVRNGVWVGPELFVASPQLVGKWLWDTSFQNYEIVDTPAKAADAVKRFKREGYDAIKITFMVNRDAYDAIIQAAKTEGIPVTGHVGPRVKLPATLDARQQIEHMDEFIDMLLPDTTYNHGESVSDMNIWRAKAWATVPYLDESKLPTLVKQVKLAGIYVSPTNYFFLSSFGEIPTEDFLKKKADYPFIPKSLNEGRWKTRERYKKMANSGADMLRYSQLRKKMVLELWKAGVPLMAGSDSPEFFLVTGFSLHDELAAFVQAGLTPFAALQTATVNTAAYLGMSQATGAVKEGMTADLVLLDKNPLEFIGNTRSVAGVFKGMQWYSRARITKMLDEARALGTNY